MCSLIVCASNVYPFIHDYVHRMWSRCDVCLPADWTVDSSPQSLVPPGPPVLVVTMVGITCCPSGVCVCMWVGVGSRDAPLYVMKAWLLLWRCRSQ